MVDTIFPKYIKFELNSLHSEQSLCKAFDTVNHDVLRAKCCKLGSRYKAPNVFKFKLKTRQLFDEMNRKISMLLLYICDRDQCLNQQLFMILRNEKLNFAKQSKLMFDVDVDVWGQHCPCRAVKSKQYISGFHCFQ